MSDYLTTEADWDAAEHAAVTAERDAERASELRALMTPACELTPGMTVECPRRSSVGSHDATITHATRVGSGSFRIVVSLDCGHDVNLTAGHGLYVR